MTSRSPYLPCLLKVVNARRVSKLSWFTGPRPRIVVRHVVPPT
ncbi:hypothetical protein [Kribbella steppae]|nr:hypothetical protein [Kribbella steppae]